MTYILWSYVNLHILEFCKNVLESDHSEKSSNLLFGILSTNTSLNLVRSKLEYCYLGTLLHRQCIRIVNLVLGSLYFEVPEKKKLEESSAVSGYRTLLVLVLVDLRPTINSMYTKRLCFYLFIYLFIFILLF